ncbi:hypothetical protein AAHE18_03G137400 [Arachis hypogaea]
MAVKVYIVLFVIRTCRELAKEINKGADSIDDVEATLWQVPETLSEEVLDKMGVPSKNDVPLINPKELLEGDGFVFGFPTRFGTMAAQFKFFLDATGSLWQTQQLAGRLASIVPVLKVVDRRLQLFLKLLSINSLTAITQLVHHGMLFVPIGYTFGGGMFEMNEVKGGSTYGAGTYAGGDGSRQPTKLELEQAFHQGKYIATITKKLKKE